MMTEKQARATITAWAQNRYRGAEGAALPACSIECLTYSPTWKWWEATIQVAGERRIRYLVFWRADTWPYPFCVHEDDPCQVCGRRATVQGKAQALCDEHARERQERQDA